MAQDTFPPNGKSKRERNVLLTVVLIVFGGLGSIVVIQIMRPGDDNLPLFTLIAAFATPTLVSVLGLLSAQETRQVAQETRDQAADTHNLINTKMAELAEQTRIATAAAQEVAKAANGKTVQKQIRKKRRKV